MLGKKALFAATSVASVFALIAACTENDTFVPPTATFPYGGPSCSGDDFNSDCWICVLEECADAEACLQPDAGECTGYFDCYCGCAQGDSTCQSACQAKQTTSCTTCEDRLTACEALNCSASCGNVVVPGADAGAEGGEGGSDATVEGSAETGTDAGSPDAVSDAPHDASSDTSVAEGGVEAGSDSGTDGAMVEDGGSEASVPNDAGAESGLDGGGD